jgi:hypothetical protein
MPLSIGKFTERIQFFDGQRLFASDLQDLEQFNREMRRLHNQSLHQAGVASGFAVVGKKDDRQVTIEPGYAIDSFGREIVLTEPLVLQVPPVANDRAGRPIYYDLVVSYPSDAELTENRAGVCVARGAVRLREEPVFCWVELSPTDTLAGAVAALVDDRAARLPTLNSDIESGKRLRLARAEVFNCKLNQPLSIAQRRNARPQQQPYMFAGNTLSQNAAWSIDPSNLGLTLKLKVDTRIAQFRSTPSYFAHVIGDRFVTLPSEEGASGIDVVVDGFGRVETPSPTTFVFSMLVPRVIIGDRNFERVVKQLEDGPPSWYVEWLGVEG